ncbi:RNA polymerase sigma factor SigE [Corynebacterium auris]|uniref:RNA polymerase sigma factor SigE n=1 Tax=Corynebacterium auris TaxID=44750 RepID=UPI0025B5FE47|nr:RNA polymerase sigma factor SigE [Corynebacterium auris]WJY67774.1 ECF RNA polymerase sigma factor SigE [Corynebacterium auris]
MSRDRAHAARRPSPQPAEEPAAPLRGTAAFDAGQADMPSWGELVAEHADSVYRLAFRLSGNQHDAEDLTQETFMRVFRNLKNYQPGTFEGWLHRITTNLFLDMVRHRAKIRMEALPEDYERVPGTDMTPEQAFTASNLDPALQKALDDLSPDFRVAVVLCDVVGMSYEEIADTLGVKMGTVRSRIHRGRTQLRENLEAQAREDDGAHDLIRIR